MIRRMCLVAVVVLALFPIGGMAVAGGGGPVSVTIEGPGLDEPIELAGFAPTKMVEPADNKKDAVASFLQAAGFSELVFGSEGVGLPTDLKHAPDGPVYLVTVDGFAEIPMEIYPYGDQGPLVFVEPGLYPADHGEGFGARGGWFSANPELLEVMVGLGVPLDKTKSSETALSKVEAKSDVGAVPAPEKSPIKASLEILAKKGTETPANLPVVTETEVLRSGLPIGRALVGIGLVSVVAAMAWVGVRRPRRAAAG